MKKGAKIALCVLVVAVAAGGAAAAWQWNNINAARYGLTMDKDSISQRLEENQRALNDAMVKYNVTQYNFSQEEIEQLADGSLAPEEAARRLLDGGGAEHSGTPAPDASPTPTSTLSTGGDTAAVEAAEEEIREEIATMYVLRSTYVGKLEAIVQSAIDEYTAGEHTSERRTQVVYGKLEELTALEKECDQKVAAVVARLRELLKATGQDDSLAKEVEATYEEEKSLKKAYYLKEFQGG